MLQGRGHFSQTQGAGVFGVIEGQGNLLVALVGGMQNHGTAEAVGIRRAEGTLGAVDLDDGQTCAVDIKGGDDGGDRTRLELHHAVVGGGDVYGDNLTVMLGAGAGTGGEGGGNHTAHALDAAHKVDQRGDVVGTHIQHGAAAELVVELGIGMPGLVAVAGKVGGSTHDIADGALVDELTAGLNAGTHVGVGSACDPQTLLLGQLDQLNALLPGSAQGLLGVDGLTCQQGGLGDLVVLVGAGDVQHDVHLGIGEQLVHIVVELGDVVLLDRIFSALADEVADADDLDVLESLGDVLQVDAGNGADTDKADSFHG